MESPMMMMQPVLVNPPRRLSAVATGHAELAVSGLALPPNVLRLPRGPDKGKGFQRWCKTRMAPTQSQTQQASSAPQRKSRAIPIVAPPAEDAKAAQGAAAAAAPVSPPAEAPAPAAGAAAAPPVAAPAAPNNNLIVNLESSDSDEGHFSDHDLDENERTR